MFYDHDKVIKWTDTNVYILIQPWFGGSTGKPPDRYTWIHRWKSQVNTTSNKQRTWTAVQPPQRLFTIHVHVSIAWEIYGPRRKQHGGKEPWLQSIFSRTFFKKTVEEFVLHPTPFLVDQTPPDALGRIQDFPQERTPVPICQIYPDSQEIFWECVPCRPLDPWTYTDS